MPIEFNNESQSQRPGTQRSEAAPAISFSQDKALANSAKASTISWVLILLILLPVAGVMIGIFQIQEARQAASRGNPWNTGYVQGLYVATGVGLAMTVLVGLLSI